ncbi:hypothetical protein [Streptomyces sp. SCL15-6]|uniref:hypothetical protein n=1 Tax=Streptomyces sp. SCL15-6 TaxID=2967222 RepID=UPI00296633EF|nr:hypothetical protein [Streptomyces sp. SCL15-6]
MRIRLLSAVRALLADPRMAGQKDAVRLAAVVLLAKSPVASLTVRIRTAELGRWLGCTASHVAHAVLPALKESGIATSETLPGADGRVAGLALRLEPLREARAEGGDHPLHLTRGDLATMLRLCEAVIGPGWAPKDGPVTPAGLLGDRRGRGASTDRLALLLLVLQARPDGRVRMVGGSVAAGRGRADATVAHLLGCSVSGGSKVVRRLESGGLVEVRREETVVGCFGRGRIWVPTVAEAHGLASAARADQAPGHRVPASSITGCERDTEQPAPRHGDLSECGTGSVQGALDEALEPLNQRPAATSGDLHVSPGSTALVPPGSGGAVGRGSSSTGERPAAAELHAGHALVVEVSGSGAGELVGFSGSAVKGVGPLRDRADVREHHLGIQDLLGKRASEGKDGPLRGEQQDFSLVDSRGRAQAARLTRCRRHAVVPDDLATVLMPVAGLWARLEHASTCRWLAGMVRSELARLRGLVGGELAERVLAERLEHRLRLQGSQPVSSVQGWLVKRGLPQRPGCWSHLCDDGVRMDTGASCPSCDSMLGDRRAARRAVTTSVATESGHLPPRERRQEVERRLREQVRRQALDDLVRRERAVAEVAARRSAVAGRRAELQEQRQEQAAAACVQCGMLEAAGLCMVCSYERRIERLVCNAVDITVAMRAALEDDEAIAALTQQVEQDTRALLVKACTDKSSREPALLAYARHEVAERILAGRKAAALQRLANSPEAEQEAARVYAAEMRRRGRFGDQQVAEESAQTARETVARALLTERLGRLVHIRSVAAPWGDRGGQAPTDRAVRLVHGN